MKHIPKIIFFTSLTINNWLVLAIKLLIVSYQ